MSQTTSATYTLNIIAIPSAFTSIKNVVEYMRESTAKYLIAINTVNVSIRVYNTNKNLPARILMRLNKISQINIQLSTACRLWTLQQLGINLAKA